MLALDTTDRFCSVACRFQDVTHVLQSESGVKNTDVILHMILEVCAKHDSSLSDIEKIVLTVGPGSFTGVRVGVMLSNIIALANKACLYPLTSLLAQLLPLMQVRGYGTYASLIDARMQECYFAAYMYSEAGYSEIYAPVLLNIEKAKELALEYDYQQDNFSGCNICVEQMLELTCRIQPESQVISLYVRSPY